MGIVNSMGHKKICQFGVHNPKSKTSTTLCIHESMSLNQKATEHECLESISQTEKAKNKSWVWSPYPKLKGPHNFVDPSVHSSNSNLWTNNESKSSTQTATEDMWGQSTYTQLRAPQNNFEFVVDIPNSKSLEILWIHESTSQTQKATQLCGSISPYLQLKQAHNIVDS